MSSLGTSLPSTWGDAAAGAGGNSGSTKAEMGEKVDGPSPSSPKLRRAADSRFWKNSSRTWTARRSAGSPLGELSPSNKCRTANSSISRSMSYERITTSYLSGEWPRTWNLQHNRLNSFRNSFHHRIVLTADKWTQTSDGFGNHECGSSKMQIYAEMPLSSSNSDRKNQNLAERRLASDFLESDPMICGSQNSVPDNGLCWPLNTRTAYADTCHRKNLTNNQCGADGFNQEVEKLIQFTGVLESGQLKRIKMMTPDGHRAPIAELLSMGCPNGRMLSGCPANSHSENHFVRISEDVADSPLIRPVLADTNDSTVIAFNFSSMVQTSGQCQRPKYVIVSPSPVVRKNLPERMDPEGSETETKLIVDIRNSICNNSSSPVKKKTLMRFNIPSERSAFCPLLKKYVGKKSLLTLSLSASTKGEIQ